MTRSLRSQLLVGLTLGALLVVLLAGVALHQILRRSINAEFNRNLLDRARAIAKIVESENGRIIFEWAHYDPHGTMKPLSTDGDGHIFQIWTADGDLFVDNAVFHGFELSPPSADQPSIASITLPDGSEARTVSFRFKPIVDEGSVVVEPLPVFGITVARRTLSVTRTMDQAGLTLVAVAGAALLTSILGMAGLIHWSLRPLRPVIRQLQGIGTGDLSRRIEPGNLPRELVPLIDTINALIAGLETKVARERRFVADAAHELRNPISAVRANLEVGLLERATDEARAQTMRFCLDATTQLQLVCERLLSLAGLQGGRIELELQIVDLTDLIESTLADLQPAAHARRITFNGSPREPVQFETDPVLVSVILSNLLRNAVAYADPREPVHVAARVDSGSAYLTITNAIAPDRDLDPGKAVEPFWRADGSRSVGEGHAGLGLTIANSAAERLLARLDCRVEPGGDRFTVEVIFPVRWPASAQGEG